MVSLAPPVICLANQAGVAIQASEKLVFLADSVDRLLTGLTCST
jgi:hypothetical protein